MANVNFCVVCGSEVLTGVDAGECYAIGYCECSVPEVDVFVLEDTDMPCCVTTDKIFIFCGDCGHEGSDPCGCPLPVSCVVCNTSECDGKCDDGRVEIEDEEFIYVYEEAEVLAASVIGCSSCGQAACQGPNERGYCLEYYDNENEAAFRKFQGLEEDGPEPQVEKVRSFYEEAFLMLAILTSFFRLLYAISTGKVNDPSLVIAWYAFCGYLILSYTAVILWFVL
jgi:hypothetical protein